VATLVTGLGYIGAALAQRLLAAGEEVIGVENFFSTPRRPIARLAECDRLRLIEGSIADPATFERAFAGTRIETVFHLAGQSSAQVGAERLAYTQETNFLGPRLLLEACQRHGVPRTILASSMRLYRPPLPLRVGELAPLHGPDLVHLSQLYGEVLLATVGLPGAAVRLGIVHGLSPVMKRDPRFLAVPQRFCLQATRGEPLIAATGPATLLAFVHLDDAVEGLLRCRDLPPGVRVANLAAEVRTVASVAEAVRAAAHARGIEPTIQFRGRPRTYRPRRVESGLDATGFQAQRRLEDSVGAVLDHYLTHNDQAAGPCASW
jgi:UDP-glucuronate 4-epimerase